MRAVEILRRIVVFCNGERFRPLLLFGWAQKEAVSSRPKKNALCLSAALVFVVGAMHTELFCALTRRYGGDWYRTVINANLLLRLALRKLNCWFPVWVHPTET